MFTLRRLLTNVKGKDKPEHRPRAVDKIQCSDCQATFIGETGRNLTTRLNEHNRAAKKGDLNNNVAEHHLKASYTIDWDYATRGAYSKDYYQRITLESWLTNLEKIALNRCQPLPAPYVTLSENAERINDEDDEVKLNTLTHFNKKTEHAFNGLHVYISVLTHFMYNT